MVFFGSFVFFGFVCFVFFDFLVLVFWASDDDRINCGDFLRRIGYLIDS